MPRPRFEKLQKEKQEAILNIAAEEFAKTGYRETSLNQIIARLEISKGAMYYYFDDKADLYSTVLQRVFDVLHELLFSVEFDLSSEESYWNSMREVFLSGFSVFAQDPTSVTLYKGILQIKYDPEVATTFAGLIEVFSSWERNILTEGQKAGAVRNDLPIELLVYICTGIAEAFDLWFATCFTDGEIDQELITDIIEKQLEIMRSVFSPR